MFAILLLSAMVSGQCGPRGCPAPGYAPSPSFAPLTLAPAAPIYVQPARPYYVIRDYPVNHDGVTFTVRGYKTDAGRVRWYPGEYGNQRAWDAAKARKQAATPSVVVRPERRPTATPDRPLDAKPEADGDNKPIPHPSGQTLNFGLAPDKMRPGSTYTASSPEARRFVQEAKADSASPGRFHVTVVGTDDERAPVVNDLLTNPAFASLKPSMMVQDYSRDEWQVDPSLGFVTTGKPTIIVQSARGPNDPKGGRVVYRASDYSMGPEALAEAIRKANPDYKPSADPGPSTGKPSASACPFGFTRDHWPHILIVGIATLALHLLPRKGV